MLVLVGSRLQRWRRLFPRQFDKFLKFFFAYKSKFGMSGEMSTILVTHDLALVASFAQSVTVMYTENILEFSSVEEVYKSPFHPYSKALLAAILNTWADKKRTWNN